MDAPAPAIDMLPFHVVIRAVPNAKLRRQTITLAGSEVDALIVPTELQATPLGVSFEEAAENIEAFPRMHVEPDGSFVWVSDLDVEQAWQVDGNLYDRDGSLVAIDLKGSCSRSHLTRLLDVFRAESRELMIELVSIGAFVCERDFLDLLS